MGSIGLEILPELKEKNSIPCHKFEKYAFSFQNSSKIWNYFEEIFLMRVCVS